MSRLLKLKRDARGTAAIEMAVVLPVLVGMIYGIFQLGILFQAQAGMQHALGEAARYATLYPSPSDTLIKAKVTAKTFGTYNGTLSALSISNYKSDGTAATTVAETKYKVLSLTYTQPANFLFLTLPNMTLTRTKRVYVGV